MWLALGIIKVAGRDGVIDQIIFGQQGLVQSGADFEALVRQLNGRLHEGGPGQLAMFFVGCF